MGACAIMEVIILPSGLKAESVEQDEGHMGLAHLGWSAQKIIRFWEESSLEKDAKVIETEDPLLNLVGKEKNDFLTASFTDSVGGLAPQIDSIVRRVLDGRIYRSIDENNEKLGAQNLAEAKELESLGLTAVRGLLLVSKCWNVPSSFVISFELIYLTSLFHSTEFFFV